jgi:hypothetical protein
MTQTLVVSLLAWVAVAPYLVKTGYSPATHTYIQAAERLWAGSSPYAAALPPADVYKYSPLFAQFFQLFLPLPAWTGSALWGALNALVFFWGLFRFVPLLRPRKENAWVWIGVLLAAMELNGALRHQQVNALLAGLCLAGLADFRDGRFTRSAWLWALAANWKILPLPIAGALAIAAPRRFGLPFVAASAAFLLIPALQVGPSTDLRLHLDWLEVLGRDLGRQGLLDARSLLLHVGLPSSAEAFRWLCGGATAALYLWALFPRGGKGDSPLEGLLPAMAACGWTAILLLNTGSEAPTFVLLAPAYLAWACRREPFARATLLVGAALVTVLHSDLWPRAVRLPGWETFGYKPLGTAVLWAASCAWLFSELRTRGRSC